MLFLTVTVLRCLSASADPEPLLELGCKSRALASRITIWWALALRLVDFSSHTPQCLHLLFHCRLSQPVNVGDARCAIVVWQLRGIVLYTLNTLES